MELSRLEENAAGQKYLVVFYDADLRNWNQVIKAAMQKHKTDTKIPILALPKKENS